MGLGLISDSLVSLAFSVSTFSSFASDWVKIPSISSVSALISGSPFGFGTSDEAEAGISSSFTAIFSGSAWTWQGLRSDKLETKKSYAEGISSWLPGNLKITAHLTIAIQAFSWPCYE